MFSVSTPISVDAADATSRLHYKVTLLNSGQPLPGQEVKVTLEGDGSLQPGHDAKQIRRETDATGVAAVTWYRRSIFGRNVKATLTVEATQADCTLTLDAVEAPPTLKTGWTQKLR